MPPKKLKDINATTPKNGDKVPGTPRSSARLTKKLAESRVTDTPKVPRKINPKVISLDDAKIEETLFVVIPHASKEVESDIESGKMAEGCELFEIFVDDYVPDVQKPDSDSDEEFEELAANVVADDYNNNELQEDVSESEEKSPDDVSIIKGLLEKAGLSEDTFIPLLRRHGVSDKNVHDLSTIKIKDIFSDFEPVYCHSFNLAVTLFKAENPVIPTNQKESRPENFVGYMRVKHTISIKRILQEDIAGQQILEIFKKTGKLDQFSKKKITYLVVNHVLRERIWLEKKHFVDLTDKILKCFSKEKESCFTEDQFFDGTSGPLFNRYNNQLTNLRKKLSLPYIKEQTKERAATEKANGKKEELYKPTSEEEELIKKVQEMCPWSIFRCDWNSLWHIRSKDILQMEFQDFLKKWPIIGNGAVAMHVVNLDFSNMFPKYKDDFFTRWEKLESALKVHTKTKEKFVIEDGDANKHIKVFQALHHVLPSAMQMVATREKPRIGATENKSLKPRLSPDVEVYRNKFSVIDSINSTMMILKHTESVTKNLTEYAEKTAEMGLHFHPLLLVITQPKPQSNDASNGEGNPKTSKKKTTNKKQKDEDEQVPLKYLIWHNKIVYVITTNFVDALKAYLQVFQYLNYRFPAQSSHVLHFLSKYFFDIELPKKEPGLSGIKNLLETIKKST